MASRSAAFAARPAKGTIRAADRLVVALDFGDIEQADQIVDKLGNAVLCYKVGLHLQFVSGVDKLIDRLVELHKYVFWDAKVNDIEGTVRAAVRGAVKRKAKFLTIHGNGDVTDAALKAASDERKGSDLRILLVTVLTSMSNREVWETYRQHSALDLAKHRAARALEFDLDGVICSGREAADIRALAGPNKEFLIATPGIRPEGASRDDQQRVMTPNDAILSGADYLIVGRPVIHAPDPITAASKIIDEMQAAFDNR